MQTDDDFEDGITDEDYASGRFVIVMRRNGKIVRDKNGNAIPRSLHQHNKAQEAVETEEMQEEATQLFSCK